MAIEITETNRDLYGGDIAIISTIPKIHPKLGIPLDQTRGSLQGGSYYLKTFWRGDIVYTPDPTLEHNFTWYADDGAQQSRKYWMLLTREKGFVECRAKEWNLRPELRQVFTVVDDRICLPIGRNAVGKEEYEVLLVRPAERFFQEMAKMQQMTDILPDSAKRIQSSVDDTRGVTVLPPEMTKSEHRYDVGDVKIKQPTL